MGEGGSSADKSNVMIRFACGMNPVGLAVWRFGLELEVGVAEERR